MIFIQWVVYPWQVVEIWRVHATQELAVFFLIVFCRKKKIKLYI